MNFSFEVGDTEKSRVDFTRNGFTGRTTVIVNGQSVTLASPTDLSTHFEMRLTKHWQFTVGDKERHQVVIEKIRPLLFAGFRPCRYRVHIDGSLSEEHYGF